MKTTFGTIVTAALLAGGLCLIQAQEHMTRADYDAVGKRLRAAVEAGELTGDQARAMLATLKGAGDGAKEVGSERAKTHLMEVKKELGAAVEAGKISREDAVKRYQGAERAIKERMAAAKGQRTSKPATSEDVEAAGREIREAVAAGKLTKEEGRAKMIAMRRELAAQDGDKRADYEAMERRIRAGVEAGKISEEDARARLDGMRREMAGQAGRIEGGITIEDYRRAAAEMQKMVEAGKARPEDVERRLIEMRKLIKDEGR